MFEGSANNLSDILLPAVCRRWAQSTAANLFYSNKPFEVFWACLPDTLGQTQGMLERLHHLVGLEMRPRRGLEREEVAGEREPWPRLE